MINRATACIFFFIISSFILMVDCALAHQDNVLLYPASMCRLRGDDLRAGHSRVLGVSQFGWIANISADGDPNTGDVDDFDLHLVCPIVRFARRSGDGLTVIVRFRDTERDHPQNRTRFCCTLHNASPDTTAMGADFSNTALRRDCENLNSAGFGDATLELTESNRKSGSTGVHSEDAGSYGLTCLLPPGARMIDYTVHERH